MGKSLVSCCFLRHSVLLLHVFNGPFSGTTQVSQYQKGKTNLDFTEATDNEWQWHQLGHMQVCTSLQTDNHAITPPLSFFTGPSCCPTKQHQRHFGDIRKISHKCTTRQPTAHTLLSTKSPRTLEGSTFAMAKWGLMRFGMCSARSQHRLKYGSPAIMTPSETTNRNAVLAT